MPQWLLILLHLLSIIGGVAGSLVSGSPAPGALAGVVNMSLPSPFYKTAKAVQKESVSDEKTT